MKLRKHDLALLPAIKTVLLALLSNHKEVQSAVVLVVHQAISAVHCQERNEINNNQKEIRD